MECNKDEAVRARDIAERKFRDMDFVGAKKFALKAQNLFPELEGLSQMLTIFDVHISAKNRISGGEVDWYSVLGVHPLDGEETIQKRYHTLALMLQTNKNKCLGADDAFKLVSEAWSLLSDKAKRLAFDKKMNVAQQRVSTETGVSSTATGENGFHDGNSMLNSSRTQNQNTQTVKNSITASYQKPGTFWTICNRCKTQYEYLRVYLNHTLLCPNCKEAFFAVEKSPPSNVVKSPNYSSGSKYQNSRHLSTNSNSSNSNNSPDLGWNQFSRMAGPRGESSSTPVQRSILPHHADEQVKIQQDQVRAAAEWERRYASKKRNSALRVDHRFKTRRINESNANCYGADMLNQMGTGNGGVGNYGISVINSRSITNREPTFIEVQTILLKKAREDVRMRLKEWSSNQTNLKGNKKQRRVLYTEATNQKKYDDSAAMNGRKQNKKALPGLSSDDTAKEVPSPMSINVPDPDFHNFDLDRTEGSFGDNQVWAAYDENDGMPRYYAWIHKVISLKPFKMKISWLNSRSNNEFSPVDWVGSGFPKTCGDFRTGRHEITETLNSFSHQVKFTKGVRGIIRILPRNGDVWALYRNWSSDWNEDTPNDMVHKYDMVEVVDDYDEEHGISVVPLIKVTGFKAVFCKHMDPEEVKRIPKEEMFRFSHQVPDHLITGEEAHNAPKGCWELDPAATPLELLQVITEANEEKPMETGGKAEEGQVQNMPKLNVDQVMENVAEAKEAEMLVND